MSDTESPTLAEMKALTKWMLRPGQAAFPGAVLADERPASVQRSQDFIRVWTVGEYHPVSASAGQLRHAHAILAAGPAYMGPPLPEHQS